MNQMAFALNLNGWEVILGLFLIGGSFLLGLAIGKSRVFLLILGSYISYALMNVVPFKKIFPALLGKEENFVVLIVVFFALMGLVYLILSRSILKSGKRKMKSVFHALFLSLFLMGILVSVVFSFFPADLLSAFSKTTKIIFNTSTARLLWLVLPLIFIGIFKGGNSKAN